MGGVVFFTFIFLMFQALRLAEFFIIHGVGFSVIAKLTGSMVLTILPFTLSVSFLIGVLVALRRLCVDGEWTALGACGYGMGRLSRPLWMAAGAVSLLTLGLTLSWAPMGERNIKGMLVKIGNTKITASLQAGAFTFGFFDLLIYADQIDSKSDQLKNVFIYDERRPGDPVAVVAKRGSILPIQADRELDLAHVLQLKDGNIHHNMRESSSYQKVDFEEYNLFLMINEGQNIAANTPKMKSWGQIMADRKTYADRADMKAEFDAEIWRRIATALSPLAFLVAGLGFGVIRNRSPRVSATLVAFGCMVVYLLAESFSVNAVMNQGAPAWITMMSGNLLVVFLGIIAGYRSRRS